MTDRVWVEMPAIGTGVADDRVRAKYPIQGKAFLMHQAGKVYATFADELEQQEAAKYPDCRLLMPHEARAIEETLPCPIPSGLFSDNHDINSRPVGLGDVVAWLAQKVGMNECNACQQRKRWMNRIVVWRWWRRSRP